jgi:hypothetical protein
MKAVLWITLLFGSLASLFAQTREVYIREQTGTVELLLPGSENWRPARMGDAIPTAAVLSTGFKSTAVLEIGNSTVTVLPITRLSIEEILIRDKNETVNLRLRTGRVRADVNPPPGGGIEFNVRSPIATASVRGTSFEFDSINIRVIEGTVAFSPTVQTAGARPRSVQVSAGAQSSVDQDTGKAVIPLVAAENSRSLPALAGSASTPALQAPSAGAPVTGFTPAPSPGSLNINVTLESK